MQILKKNSLTRFGFFLVGLSVLSSNFFRNYLVSLHYEEKQKRQ